MARTGVALLCDPLIDPYGVSREAILLGNYLSAAYDVSVVSPTISERVRGHFKGSKVTLVDLGRRPIASSSSMAYAETWVQETLIESSGRAWKRRRDGTPVVVNLSNTIVAPSDVWYLQGAVGYTISLVLRLMSMPFRLGGSLLAPLLGFLDERQISRSSSTSSVHVANSRFCQTFYGDRGVPVNRVIHPPLDGSVFHPTTSRPSEEYCVVYLGKETDPRMLLALADAGIPLRAFGMKGGKVPIRVRTHPRISVEDHFTDGALAGLYSHAKMTIFPFTTEPFGYIPVESAACGTPVLTYDREGPAETVLPDRTGWVYPDDRRLIRKAVELWNGAAISIEMRRACQERGAEFCLERVGAQWRTLIEERRLASRRADL